MAEENTQRPAQSGEPRPVRKRRRRHPVLRRVLTIIGTLLLVFVITCSFLACFAAVYIKTVIMPKTDLDVADYPMNLSSTIYYTDPITGEAVEYETLHGGEDRVLVAYENIPKDLLNAAVAIEDRRFYKHHGVDWLSTGRGVLSFFTGGKIRGGSTITQQLIKNLTQYDDVTVKRKVQEIFTALEFDKKYSKEQTLEWYLNYVYFGRNCYGVYTASYKYFGKHVSELDLAECASLISITNNPSIYDPFTHPEKNAERRGYVLDWMETEGYISEEEKVAAKAEVINFRSADSSGKTNTNYSWYTEQVITDVINDLMDQYNYSETVAKDLVYSGGLEIYACLDPKVQAAVEDIYSNAENLPYTSPSGQQLQSAIVVVDPQGNVVGLAGKMGEKTVKDTRGWNRASRTQRQPGSSIKPLSVYAPALEMGLITPYSVLEDSPPMLLGEKPWPSNVNNRYFGQMTVDYAVANSTNTVAVRTLMQVTPQVGYEYLVEKFGVDPDHLVVSRTINGSVKSDIGYSQLALGGLTDGVSTMDMAGAYSVFPRNGVYIKPRTYSKVVLSAAVDPNQRELLNNESVSVPVLKEKTVYYINEMLQHVVTEGGGDDAYFEGMTIAGKTGSTTSNCDRWFVGYTPYYTAAVWVGYDNPERVEAKGNPAAKLWSMVMSQVHSDLENKSFPKPDELVEFEYCMDTGKLPTDACRADQRGSRVAKGYLYAEDVPTEYCDAHVQVEVCNASAVTEEEGETDGPKYYLAGEFCPEAGTLEDGTQIAGKVTISVLDFPREYVGGVVPEDNGYTKSALEALGTCPIHTEEWFLEPEPYDPATFDITDPSTWPTAEQDPLFDPADPATYPTAEPLLPPEETGGEIGELTPPPVPSEGIHGEEPTSPPPEVTDPPAPVESDPEILLPPDA